MCRRRLLPLTFEKMTARGNLHGKPAWTIASQRGRCAVVAPPLCRKFCKQGVQRRNRCRIKTLAQHATS